VNPQPTEPPIAQLIGWKLVHKQQHPFDDPDWYYVEDGEPDEEGMLPGRTGEPTVDDMLAWLRQHTYHHAPIGMAIGVKACVTYWPSDGSSTEFTEGPTLHAALAAAVRVVAGTPRKDQT
jgi:hypothetical protein